MSSSAYFEIEEGDIVRLVDDSTDGIRTGWINVGPHAIYVKYDPQTQNLVVESMARTNEADRLGVMSVSGQQAKEAGGVDPDADDASDRPHGPAADR